MDTPAIIFTLVFTVAAALYWGALLSDRLPDIDRRFDRKPFNCRPCFTFHLTWVASGIFALIADTWQLFAGGLCVAFVVFGVLKCMDNKKIIK